MNFIETGCRESARKIRRTTDRIRVLIERHWLTKAEIHLGMLGWTQVDFPPEVEEQIQAINACEHRQAELSNQGADLQWKIEELQSQREENKKSQDELLGLLKSKLQPALDARDAAKAPLAVKQASLQRFDQAIAELEASRHAFRIKLNELMSAEQETPEIRQQIVSIREHRAAFDTEKNDLEQSCMRVAGEIKAIEEIVAGHESEVAEWTRKIYEAEEAFAVQDAGLLSQIRDLEREKAHTEQDVARLDQNKSPAYLVIGRCLADFNLEPMNQPDALQCVLRHRQVIQNCEHRIAESLEISSGVDRESWLKFCAVVVLTLMVVLFVMAHFFNIHG